MYTFCFWFFVLGEVGLVVCVDFLLGVTCACIPSGKRGGWPPAPVGRVVYFGVPVGLLSVDCFSGFFLACCFDKVSWV